MIKIHVKQLTFRSESFGKDCGISEWIMCRSPECLVFMAHDTSNILYIGFNIFERPFSIEKDTSAAVSFLCRNQTHPNLRNPEKCTDDINFNRQKHETCCLCFFLQNVIQFCQSGRRLVSVWEQEGFFPWMEMLWDFGELPQKCLMGNDVFMYRVKRTTSAPPGRRQHVEDGVFRTEIFYITAKGWCLSPAHRTTVKAETLTVSDRPSERLQVSLLESFSFGCGGSWLSDWNSEDRCLLWQWCSLFLCWLSEENSLKDL